MVNQKSVEVLQTYQQLIENIDKHKREYNGAYVYQKNTKQKK